MPRERRESTPEELATGRVPRIAKRRQSGQEKYLHLLAQAKAIRRNLELSPDALDALINQGEVELRALNEAVEGWIYPRHRPKKIETDERCTVFIDECGAHNLRAKEKLKTFCLAAVILRDSQLRDMDRQWKRWKRDYLGSSLKEVHEPDIRDGNKSFWCDGNPQRRERAIHGLDRILARLDFAAIACVVHRGEYVKKFGITSLDESLPEHPYLMAVDFLIERLAMALYYQFGGARAQIVIESRGEADDARIQYEFARLFLDGTTYVSATWIRRQFLPGLHFYEKEANISGLQLADLVARPCADKIQEPESTPDRWEVCREKLCPGQRTAHSIVGLKVIPWDEKYDGVWKS
jgi:Protein of unknown function (DUF3800)